KLASAGPYAVSHYADAGAFSIQPQPAMRSLRGSAARAEHFDLDEPLDIADGRESTPARESLSQFANVFNDPLGVLADPASSIGCRPHLLELAGQVDPGRRRRLEGSPQILDQGEPAHDVELLVLFVALARDLCVEVQIVARDGDPKVGIAPLL